MAQGPEGRPVEGPGGPGDHRSGQLGDDPLPADELEGRDHGDRHDGDGHEQGEDEALSDSVDRKSVV